MAMLFQYTPHGKSPPAEQRSALWCRQVRGALEGKPLMTAERWHERVLANKRPEGLSPRANW